MDKAMDRTRPQGCAVEAPSVFLTLLNLLVAIGFSGCGKEELAEWQVFAQDAGEDVAKLDSGIKAQETTFQTLGQKWKEQIGRKSKFYVELDQNVQLIAGLTAEIRDLEGKRLAIQEAISKNEPYTGKTGQVYKPSELVRLTGDVDAEISKKKEDIIAKRVYANGFERYAAGSWEHQSQAQVSKKELEGLFVSLRAQYDEVVRLKEHVELVKEVKEEIAQEYGTAKDEVEKTIGVVAAKLKANQGLLDSFVGEAMQGELGKTLKDF